MELPLSVVKGTDLPGLEPAGDTVEVEGMVAHAPGYGALLTGGRGLVGLTLDTYMDQQGGARPLVILESGKSHFCINLHRSIMWLRQMAQLSTTMSVEKYHPQLALAKK